jgi:hypothetical protein
MDANYNCQQSCSELGTAFASTTFPQDVAEDLL